MWGPGLTVVRAPAPSPQPRRSLQVASQRGGSIAVHYIIDKPPLVKVQAEVQQNDCLRHAEHHIKQGHCAYL